MSQPDVSRSFDVAVSYAREDRELVQQVVDGLKDAGVRVFYDNDYQSDLWGEDLLEYFDDIFRNQASYTLMFISRHYASKMWTQHERRSALAHGVEQSTPYVLPIRLDDIPLKGLRPTVGYIDARLVAIDSIVQRTLEKLGKVKPAQPRPITRVPRSEAERQQLLIDRPPSWEFFYFAAELLHKRNSVEAEYLDHEVGYARLTGEVITPDTIYEYVSNAYSDAGQLVHKFMRLMAPEVQEKTFAEPGNPERIHHLAQRWNDMYVALMRWASRIRGVTIPSDWNHALDLVARSVDEQIHDYRKFVDDMARALDAAPAAVADGQTVHLELTLEFRMSEEHAAEVMAELERLHTSQRTE
jgi:TIR domain